MTSGSSLKFATITYARQSGVTIVRPPCCGEGGEGCRMAIPTHVIILAGSIPWMCMWQDSIHTSEGMLRPFSISSLAVATCQHRGATVMFSTALTSHKLCSCVFDSGWRSSGPFSTNSSSSCFLFRELRPVFLSGNTVSAARSTRATLHVVDSSSAAHSANFPVLKFMSAPVFSKKSPPKTPAASVGSGHTKNEWTNFRPPSVKVTSCWPLQLKGSSVTPKGFRAKSFIWLDDTPGWSIDTFEPVSTISGLALPSISIVMEGAPSSNRSELVGFSTTFPWVLKWGELSHLSPLVRFPYSSFRWSRLAYSRKGILPRPRLDVLNARYGLTSRVAFENLFLFLVVWDTRFQNGHALRIRSIWGLSRFGLFLQSYATTCFYPREKQKLVRFLRFYGLSGRKGCQIP